MRHINLIASPNKIHLNAIFLFLRQFICDKGILLMRICYHARSFNEPLHTWKKCQVFWNCILKRWKNTFTKQKLSAVFAFCRPSCLLTVQAGNKAVSVSVKMNKIDDDFTSLQRFEALQRKSYRPCIFTFNFYPMHCFLQKVNASAIFSKY